MHTRNQTKPPLTPGYNVSQSPSNKSENLDESQLNRRQKIGGGNMVGKANSARCRLPLSSMNTISGDNGGVPDTASSNGDCDGAGVVFNSREDVAKLLSEKSKPRSKADVQGRMNDMRNYIKRLKSCISWYIDLEDCYLAIQDELNSLLESEKRRHSEIESQMNSKIEELTSLTEEYQTMKVSLEENLRREESNKLVAIKAQEKEAEARAASENLRYGLMEDLEKATQKINHLNNQIKMIQETNKRLQEYNTSLQQYNSNLQDDAVKNGDTISKLQMEKNAMVETITGLRDQSSLLRNQLENIRSSKQETINQKEEFKKEAGCLRSELQQVREDRDNQLAHVKSMTAELNIYKEINGKNSIVLDTTLAKVAALEETCSSQQIQIKNLQYKLEAASENIKRADLVAIETVQDNEAQKKLICQLQCQVADLEHQLIESEKLRKKLHNTILELKGNIRVFCRVRPVLSDVDARGADGSVISYPTSVESLGRGIDLMYSAQKYCFTFDKVFAHKSSQEEVFVEISQLVQSALDGYKVCIFAYGQTGSGKTYTMMGKPEAPEQKGLIPRSLEQIFETSQSLQCQGWTYKMQASMLEIYNETIRDLLSPNRSTSSCLTLLNKQYTIKHDSAGNTHVPDLTVVDVCSIKEISFLLDQAARSRSVGKTQMNEQSSRSHFVFTLRISGVNVATEQQVQGVLNLIDLAGSERLAKSGSTGDRLKETQAINKSLSSLSDVIFAIAKKEDHVPYRNSKLTYLLQPCLGGDSKTLMFVNISPEVSSASESICSLRFAARVNACEIGVPRRQTQMRPLDSR
ncbi:hypothetical protein HPP92_010851 [Vanilla planifolia]|uniref:Kinesin-like protein n=1 Tax=Vanilla planifolia TaxID=51239 RepID=A0A835V288_VANPL|nr:hypothetical protein HPP92_010851 [Vanilla planifolia]